MMVFMLGFIIFYDYLKKYNSIGFFVMYVFIFFFVNFGLNSMIFIVFVEFFFVCFWLICYGIFVVVGKVGVIIGFFGFLYVV